MSYVEDVLGKDERVQYRAKVSMLSYWFNFAVGGLFLLIGFTGLIVDRSSIGEAGETLRGIAYFWLGLGTILVTWPLLVRATTELVLTNRRVIAKFGVISRDTVEINIKKIESIRVKQGIFGRILGYGDVVVGGSGATHAPVPRIADPLEYRRAFDVLIEHEEKIAKVATTA
jgi:uncharacterized membrane protein YdbT with pleckstrin-like domain